MNGADLGCIRTLEYGLQGFPGSVGMVESLSLERSHIDQPYRGTGTVPEDLDEGYSAVPVEIHSFEVNSEFGDFGRRDFGKECVERRNGVHDADDG